MNEVERYIETAKRLSENGRYAWWSRLAQILTDLSTGPYECPCRDEGPDPCPACGATVEGNDRVGGVCQARK